MSDDEPLELGEPDDLTGIEWLEMKKENRTLRARVKELEAQAAAMRLTPHQIEEAIKRRASHCKHKEHGHKICAGCAALAVQYEQDRWQPRTESDKGGVTTPARKEGTK